MGQQEWRVVVLWGPGAIQPAPLRSNCLGRDP